MTRTAYELLNVARDNLVSGNLNEAGEYYIVGAHAEFANTRVENDDGTTVFDSNRFGVACSEALKGLLCYRFGSPTGREQSAAAVWKSVVDDVESNEPAVFDYAAMVGLCSEVRGDYATVLGDSDAEDHYETAAEHYATVENPIQWQAEYSFGAMVMPVVNLVEAADVEWGEFTREQVVETDLQERIAFKRSHLPDVVDSITEEALRIALGTNERQ